MQPTHSASLFAEAVSLCIAIIVEDCSAPKPSIAPEPIPYNSASELESARVFCVRGHTSTAKTWKGIAYSPATVTSFFLVSTVAINRHFQNFRMMIACDW